MSVCVSVKVRETFWVNFERVEMMRGGETGMGSGGGGGYGRISKKWVGFVTAIWVQSIAGNNYTFANYSGALKTVMQYDQTQLNNLGVAKDVGKSFGLVAGFLADYMPTWAILLIGALEGLVGYGVQYLVVSQRVARLPFWQVGCFLLLLLLSLRFPS